jgi:hypothetical protein
MHVKDIPPDRGRAAFQGVYPDKPALILGEFHTLLGTKAKDGSQFIGETNQSFFLPAMSNPHQFVHTIRLN